MANKKIWNLLYVVGDPAMSSRVTASADNPMSRADALAKAEAVANNGGGWRVWVKRSDTGERIFQSAAEEKLQASLNARMTAINQTIEKAIFSVESKPASSEQETEVPCNES